MKIEEIKFLADICKWLISTSLRNLQRRMRSLCQIPQDVKYSWRWNITMCFWEALAYLEQALADYIGLCHFLCWHNIIAAALPGNIICLPVYRTNSQCYHRCNTKAALIFSIFTVILGLMHKGKESPSPASNVVSFHMAYSLNLNWILEKRHPLFQKFLSSYEQLYFSYVD